MVEFYNTLTGVKPIEVLTGPGNAYVDVRDLARALIIALQSAEAGNQRIIVSAGSYFWQELGMLSSSLPVLSLCTVLRC